MGPIDFVPYGDVLQIGVAAAKASRNRAILVAAKRVELTVNVSINLITQDVRFDEGVSRFFK